MRLASKKFLKPYVIVLNDLEKVEKVTKINQKVKGLTLAIFHDFTKTSQI
jgi:hypothetical protein